MLIIISKRERRKGKVANTALCKWSPSPDLVLSKVFMPLNVIVQLNLDIMKLTNSPKNPL